MVDWALVSGMGDENDFDESLFDRGRGGGWAGIGPVAFCQPRAGVIYPIAVNGWSTNPTRYASASPSVPRSGFKWNEAEDRDLLAAAGRSVDLGQIAEAHGRTETAIACRLEHLGYDKTALIAMDFADVELRTMAHLIADKQKGNTDMKMTPDRLILLLTAYEGRLDEYLRDRTARPRAGSTAAHLSFLAMEGLMAEDGLRGRIITDEGRAVVEDLLGKSSTGVHGASRSGASTSWNHARESSVLDDQRFFLIASGDCMKAASHGKPALKKPPTTVQGSRVDAEREAKRLAGLSRGEKFFVLQATSVHEIAPAPATSKRL